MENIDGHTTLEILKTNFPNTYKKIKILIACGNKTFYRSNVSEFIKNKEEYALAALEEYRAERADGDYPKTTDDLFLLNILTSTLFTGNAQKEVYEVLAT